ncbi:hypothetical protein H2508_10780 [Parahaliea sp. F7430]|uniref:Uncharacterized protein n=1 Tax=Sediminihaliea albiluteola TaxID=2758564 RepID=A0A7W2TXG3_9GAMM|nr:conjugative transfer protein MobI(A/C) [Sediminihaliea albiluteola]MBA6413594.1 hypothetical protein [Sediminihaliea albiluteola]
MTRMNKRQVVEQWCKVSRLEGVDHTRGTQAAIKQSKAFLQTLIDLIDVEQARYRYIAQRICDVHWEHNIAHRTDQTEGYPGHHGCRVRLRGRKLELSWFYNSFVLKKNGTGYAVYSEHISKQGRYRHFKSAFVRAQNWEKPVIADIEDGFELIRRLNANLTQLRRTLKSSAHLVAELEAYLEETLAPLAKAAKTEGTSKR